MSKAPEQIWAWCPGVADEPWGHCVSSITEPTKWLSTSYTRTDVAQAMVAAAYQNAAEWCASYSLGSVLPSQVSDPSKLYCVMYAAEYAAATCHNGQGYADAIMRELAPTDAKAALDRIVAEAVKEALEKARKAIHANLPDDYNPKEPTAYGVATFHAAQAVDVVAEALKGGEA